MQIIDLQPNDERLIEQVAALLVVGFAEFAPDAWPDRVSALDEVRASFGDGRISRVALDEHNDVIGWIGAIAGYDGNVWELHPLVVQPQLQRGGIGRALVADLEQQVRQRGGLTLTLGSDDLNNQTSLGGVDLYPNVWQHIAAIRNLDRHPYEFYQKLGFAISGVLPDANGFGKPDILLSKRVGKETAASTQPEQEASAYRIYTLAQRPECRNRISPLNGKVWPAFMMEDPIANRHWNTLLDTFAPFQCVLCAADDAVIAAGNAIPVLWDGTIAGLPAGWDAVLEQGVRDHQQRRPVNTLSALSITVDPQFQGQGLSRLMVQAMRSIAAEHGFSSLIAPVRPSFKSRYPLTSIAQYITWRQPDGAPFDPWLRVHWRLGAQILTVAPRSMAIPGTIAEWTEWAGMAFPASGSYVVPGALEPITIDYQQDRGEYVEPNVWMCHRIDAKNMVAAADDCA